MLQRSARILYFVLVCCSNRGYFDSISDQRTLPNDKLRTTSAISLTYTHNVETELCQSDFHTNKQRKSTHRNPHLLHRVTFPQRYRIWFLDRIEIDCNAKRNANFVRACVTFANRSTGIVHFVWNIVVGQSSA